MFLLDSDERTRSLNGTGCHRVSTRPRSTLPFTEYIHTTLAECKHHHTSKSLANWRHRRKPPSMSELIDGASITASVLARRGGDERTNASDQDRCPATQMGRGIRGGDGDEPSTGSKAVTGQAPKQPEPWWRGRRTRRAGRLRSRRSRRARAERKAHRRSRRPGRRSELVGVDGPAGAEGSGVAGRPGAGAKACGRRSRRARRGRKAQESPEFNPVPSGGLTDHRPDLRSSAARQRGAVLRLSGNAYLVVASRRSRRHPSAHGGAKQHESATLSS